MKCNNKQQTQNFKITKFLYNLYKSLQVHVFQTLDKCAEIKETV